MKALRLTIGLPLLVKELIEQAARRRTYIVRVLYACLLFSSALLIFFQSSYYRSNDPFAVLGHGRQMFETVVVLQFLGIYLFMPAMACGVMTSEKERNSLGLLFLTRLGPWTIVFEKFLGRLVPMFTYLLLSLPLLAFAYSLGGISQTYLWGGIWSLSITAVQVGALAVMCSTYCRTTPAAFIATYVIGLTLYFLVPTLDEFRLIHFRQDTAFMFFGPYVFFDNAQTNNLLSGVFSSSLPIIGSTLLFVLLARMFVVRRAFAQPRHLVLNLFRKLDRIFFKMNQNRFTRGIVLTRQDNELPEDEPVAWRETTKKSLGTARYLFRVFVALEIPLVVVCLLIALSDSGYRLYGASMLVFLLWLIAVLLVSVKSAGLIAGEHSHQTLDVLIATPMTSREIIHQKFRGVRRLMWVLFVLFLTVYLFQTWWIVQYSYLYQHLYQYESSRCLLYLICSLLSVAIYLPMIAWLSLLIGLRVRTQTRAILGSLAAIVGWCVLPYLVLIPISMAVEPSQQSSFYFLMLLSPATVVPLNEFHELREIGDSPWIAVIINFLLYGAVLRVLRNYCLMNSDRLLGRNPGN